MRDIKFRVWDKSSERWLDLDLEEYIINPKDGSVYEVYYSEISWVNNNAIIEQYTGLKDKNGVEIYEGDVVETTYYNDIDDGLGKIGTIIFEKGSFCIVFVGDTSKNKLGWIEPNETIVIGNIHENADLLVKK